MSDNMDDFWCQYWEEADWTEEEIEMEDRFRYKEWVTKDGQRLKIKNMETSHIKNCLKFINREINGKRWCYADEYTKLFNEELAARECVGVKYYFKIIFYKGGNIGGHNCTRFETRDGFLILEGYDDLNYVSGYERKYWRFKYEMNEIKEFQVMRMEESEEQYL